MPIAECQFSKTFRGGMPPDPLEPHLFPNLPQINSTWKKILTFGGPSLKKF